MMRQQIIGIGCNGPPVLSFRFGVLLLVG